MTDAAISTIAVLAGGLATRMRPLTETVPKAMLDVAGEPFITHQLRLFRREGLKHVILCVGHLGEQIMEFVGDGARFGLRVDYSFDGDRLLGTGGALRKALRQLGEHFYVIYGDSYLDTSFAAAAEHFAQSRKEGLMTVFRNEGRWDTSNVVFEAGTVCFYSKVDRRPEMQYIDYGLGILRASTLTSHAQGETFELADVYRDLVARQQLAGHEVQHRFFEIGSTRGLAETEAYISARRSG